MNDTRRPRASYASQPRLPVVIAVAAVALLDATLPTSVLVGPRAVAPAIEVLVLLAVIASNAARRRRGDEALRWLALTLVGVLGAVTTAALVRLVHELAIGKAQAGAILLLAALQVWVTNIIVFGLAFWELDRGGPVARATLPRAKLPVADFRFSQDEEADNVVEVAKQSSQRSDWRPGFIDYLYVSCTNSTAFSPTDTMPLSARAKVLMAIESVEALIVSVLVIARGVSLLH